MHAEDDNRTEVWRVEADAPDAESIARAAKIIRRGGLVAFPTETVYGLGANALDGQAVAGIFEAKGRPSNNPLIVHVSDAQAAREIAAAWPEKAARLAERFWPGPLTLVLPKRAIVPEIVTAGGPTVAVRVPAHPVAQALLRAAGVPIAAPSANRSERLSPTRAEHVEKQLSGRIDMILDGGPTSGGLESTVLSLAGELPVLLRPGLISPAEIEAVIGPIRRHAALPAEQTAALPSPGMRPRHYAPRAPLEIVSDSAEDRVKILLARGEKVGWLTFRTDLPFRLRFGSVCITMPRDPARYAARLYAALHELDAAGVTRIVVEAVPESDAWLAVLDRLRRAAAPKEENDAEQS